MIKNIKTRCVIDTENHVMVRNKVYHWSWQLFKDKTFPSTFYRDGYFPLHRIGKPAFYNIDENGNVVSLCWHLNGVMHNDTGPSCYWPYSTDNVRWYILGNKISNESVDTWIRKNGLPPWQYWTTKEKALFKLKWA